MTPVAVAVLGRGLVDPDQPVLAADDAALARGQAAFETLRVYGGRTFALDEHLERLRASAARLELPDVSRDALEGLAALALDASGLQDAALRFYWTGGRDGARQATALATVTPIPGDLEEVRARGLRVASLELGIDHAARARSPWLLGGVKSTSYAVSVAALAEARRRDADDALLLASDGTVLEGATSNVWWVAGDVVRTPGLELGILAGVTRSHLLRLATDLGYAVQEGGWPLHEVRAAAEIFLSSSVREVVGVVGVDGQVVGGGRPGPVALALQAALRAEATRGL
ncbi:MAG: aminotransferase class IV [Chloroflexi bacterium]|nr:aminotransferase class IV [Chloroflexota bacterium]